MLQHQVLLQQHIKPHSQKHQIVVERAYNKDSLTTFPGRTAEEAAQKVMERARDFGYWDATKAYPQGKTPQGKAPEPGSSRDDARSARKLR